MDTGQKEKVKQFSDVVGENEETSIQYLKKNKWNVENALNDYYEHPPVRKAPVGSAKVAAETFKKYCDASTKTITIDGVGNFFTDAGVSDLSDPVTLVIANYWKCELISSITEDNFVKGLVDMGCSTPEDVKGSLARLKGELDSPKLREIYQNAFTVNRETKHSKTLPKELAIELWKIILLKKFPAIVKFTEFVTADKEKVGINRDEWDLTYDFFNKTGGDLSKHSFDGNSKFFLD